MRDMRAMVVRNPGRESSLEVRTVPAPPLLPGHVRIEVAAAGVNRADLLQRQGLYPPPPGASDLLGLECSGRVGEVAADVAGWSEGDRVMALLTGGGYAEQVVAPAECLMLIPARLSDLEAAAVPEAFLTAHLNLLTLGELKRGSRALVHGGSGGVGTAAIQICVAAGAEVIATAGSDERCRRCLELGAAAAVNHHTGRFDDAVARLTGGRGVDVVLDCVGAPYLARNLEVLAPDGRLVVIGLMGGRTAEMDMAELLTRRLTVIGSTLRSRAVADKGALVADFLAHFGSDLERGLIAPVVDRVFRLEDAEQAHRLMAEGRHFGKLVLTLKETHAQHDWPSLCHAHPERGSRLSVDA